jgi:uncharacterized protein YeaC (DUF1315 family)
MDYSLLFSVRENKEEQEMTTETIDKMSVSPKFNSSEDV